MKHSKGLDSGWLELRRLWLRENIETRQNKGFRNDFLGLQQGVENLKQIRQGTNSLVGGTYRTSSSTKTLVGKEREGTC